MRERLIEMLLEVLETMPIDEALRAAQCYGRCTTANDENIILKFGEDDFVQLYNTEGGWTHE